MAWVRRSFLQCLVLPQWSNARGVEDQGQIGRRAVPVSKNGFAILRTAGIDQDRAIPTTERIRQAEADLDDVATASPVETELNPLKLPAWLEGGPHKAARSLERRSSNAIRRDVGEVGSLIVVSLPKTDAGQSFAHLGCGPQPPEVFEGFLG